MTIADRLKSATDCRQNASESILRNPSEWARSETGPVVAVDFETFYTSTYSVSALGSWAYVYDIRFCAYLVAVSDGRKTCVCHPKDFPWATITSRQWVSHNRDFDQAVFERLRELGDIPVDTPDPSVWFCTAALCAYLQHPRSLAGAAEAVLGITLDKSVRTRAMGESPLQGELFGSEISRYAARDAEACLALWFHLERHWPQHERQLFELTSAMGRRGLAVDWHYVSAKSEQLGRLVLDLSSALPWEPATSLKQFADACEGTGVPAPRSTSSSHPSFLRWLNNHLNTDAATWARHMQRIRSANRTAKVLGAMGARRMSSGRMAYELKYFGASTGRWSGNGGLNLQNLNRKTAEGVDLRRAIVAPPGHILATVDFAQIESRALLYLAGDFDALRMFRDNPDADAYEIHARSTMGYSDDEPLKIYCDRSGSNLRQLAKARVLGLGFGCGWQKFIEVARVMAGLELSEPDAKSIVSDFRRSNPQIVNLWYRLNDACGAENGRDFILPLPCTLHTPSLDRYLIYRDVAAKDRDITATVGGKRIHVYGGLLTENWTQATARDLLASAWLRCVSAGFPPILSVHDELVFELQESTAEADLARIISIMETPVPWAPELPLKAEGKLTPYYVK
jgi:DNA polymerase I-like protein with 3'-5' exonuclease and polymerase domains